MSSEPPGAMPPPPPPPGAPPPPPPPGGGAPPPPPGGGMPPPPPPGNWGQPPGGMPGGAQAGMAQGSFYVQMMGAEQGPLNFGDLAYQAKNGTVRTSTMVRRAEGGNWFPAGDVPWLFSDKDWLTALVISWVVGVFGIDRFYLGYSGLGVLKLITCGGCGIWALYDLIMILLNKLPDAQGRPLRRN